MHMILVQLNLIDVEWERHNPLVLSLSSLSAAAFY